MKNYRPFSLLSGMSKIFEKLMKSRIMKFVSSCDIISKNQFGFWVGHDKFLEKVYQSFIDKSYMKSIFLHFSMAFDNFLLAKSNHIGNRGDTLH